MLIEIGAGILIEGGNIKIGRTGIETIYFVSEVAQDFFITEDGNYLIDEDY